MPGACGAGRVAGHRLRGTGVGCQMARPSHSGAAMRDGAAASHLVVTRRCVSAASSGRSAPRHQVMAAALQSAVANLQFPGADSFSEVAVVPRRVPALHNRMACIHLAAAELLGPVAGIVFGVTDAPSRTSLRFKAYSAPISARFSAFRPPPEGSRNRFSPLPGCSARRRSSPAGSREEPESLLRIPIRACQCDVAERSLAVCQRPTA